MIINPVPAWKKKIIKWLFKCIANYSRFESRLLFYLDMINLLRVCANKLICYYLSTIIGNNNCRFPLWENWSLNLNAVNKISKQSIETLRHCNEHHNLIRALKREIKLPRDTPAYIGYVVCLLPITGLPFVLPLYLFSSSVNYAHPLLSLMHSKAIPILRTHLFEGMIIEWYYNEHK